MVLLGLTTIGVWIVLLANGALDGGLDRQVGPNYVAFRLAADVIVGVRAWDHGHPDEGRAFVYYGSQAGLDAERVWTADPV